MSDLSGKFVTVGNPKVYDLDDMDGSNAIGSVFPVAAGPNSILATISTAQQGILGQWAQIQQHQAQQWNTMLGLIDKGVFEELRQTLEMYNDSFRASAVSNQKILESVQAWHQVLASSITTQLQQNIAKSLEITFNFELPRVYIPSTFEEAVIEARSEQQNTESNLLSVAVDQFGSFIIGGQKIVRANANSSRHGKLLSLLENNKGHMLSKDDIKAHIKAGNPKQIMKDLKKELRQLGYQLDYKPYRYQGLVYHGIIKKQ